MSETMGAALITGLFAAVVGLIGYASARFQAKQSAKALNATASLESTKVDAEALKFARDTLHQVIDVLREEVKSLRERVESLEKHRQSDTDRITQLVAYARTLAGLLRRHDIEVPLPPQGLFDGAP